MKNSHKCMREYQLHIPKNESTYVINLADPVEYHVIINGVYDGRDHQLQAEMDPHEQKAHANGEHEALRHRLPRESKLIIDQARIPFYYP